MGIHENAIAILRAASVRRIGERRWGPGGGHQASFTPQRRASTGWDTFTWRRIPDDGLRRSVDMARHRSIAKAEARDLIAHLRADPPP